MACLKGNERIILMFYVLALILIVLIAVGLAYIIVPTEYQDDEEINGLVYSWECVKGCDRMQQIFSNIMRDVLCNGAEERGEMTIEIEHLYENMDEICDKLKATWREKEHKRLEKNKSIIDRKNDRLNELQEKLL